MTGTTVPTKPRAALTRAGVLCCAGTLTACSADQSAAIPPNPSALFPFANTVIVAQPQPGVLLIEQRDVSTNRTQLRRAANLWCGGPASVTGLSDDQGDGEIDINTTSWLVRCQYQ